MKKQELENLRKAAIALNNGKTPNWSNISPVWRKKAERAKKAHALDEFINEIEGALTPKSTLDNSKKVDLATLSTDENDEEEEMVEVSSDSTEEIK